MLKLIIKIVLILFLINSCTHKPINNSETEFKKLTTQIDTIFQNYIDKNYINSNFLKYYNKVEVDCNDVNEILHKVHNTDQKVRMTGEGDLYKIDSINQIKVISVFANCDTNNLDKYSIRGVFIMLQHTDDNDLKAYFYEYIKNNILTNYELAMYIDGFLMVDHKPQIFGTHLDNYNKLYKVQDRKNLNKRRKIMGMKPVEDYLKSRGVE
jgi:hypothetical protein